MEKQKSLKDLIRYIKHELTPVYPDREINSLTQIILNHVVNLKKTDLLINKEQHISDQHIKAIKNITEELKNHKPIQQIMGETEFYNIRLKVNKHTLIPRQETEELVDWILKDIQNEKLNILDIGTGTGCIAVALAKNLPHSEITAVDYSREILETAKENAEINHVGIRFIKANILKEDLPRGRFDVIVSNPPYVRKSEKKFMHRNVLDHEPPESLFVDDQDPLIFYRSIIRLADNHLAEKGILYFEINEYLVYEIHTLLKKYGYQNIELKKDLNNKNRMIKALK
jgi:release factor glutamine methyltransferase